METQPGEEQPTAARKWRRWLWEAARTGQPAPQLYFDDAVYHGSDLAGLMGDNAYASLVEQLVDGVDGRDIPAIAQRVLETTFPYQCRCRSWAAMDHDSLDFSGRNVCRTLYFSDASVTGHMRLLFCRTPDIDLFECRECGDVWLRALDQVIWLQHLVLLEPEDVVRIGAEGAWPTALDSYEDAWVSEYGGINRNSANLREWQAAHNTPEAFARYGK